MVDLHRQYLDIRDEVDRAIAVSYTHLRKSYYGSKQDPDAYGTTHDLTVAAGVQYVHAFRKLLFMPAELGARKGSRLLVGFALETHDLSLIHI